MQTTTFLHATRPGNRARSLASMQGTFGAQSFSCSPKSTEALALTYILRNITPEELHARLLMASTAERLMCPPSTIPNIFNALECLSIGPTAQARFVAEQDDERHCVQCHRPYLERDNGPHECRIPHDKGVLATRVDMNGKIGHYYPCCNVSLDTTESPGDWCVVGRHTTQSYNVKYNNSNVRKCSILKCAGAASPSQQTAYGYGDDSGEESHLV